MDHSLYVVTSFFNPQQYASRTRLYHQFAKHMRESGVKLLTVEAAFGDHPHQVTSPGDPFQIQLRTDQILWHKEAMINLGIERLKHVASDSRFIGWIDADVTFANPDWVGEAVHSLMHHPVIQPFGQAINLDANEESMWSCPSSSRSFIEERGYHQEPPIPVGYLFKGHPGLAWAATREALDALGGLYDLCAAGSGDTVMSNCLKGDWSVYLPASPSDGMVRSIKRWAARCDRFIRTNVGYSRGSLLHHWHGKSEKRGYEKRWSILSFHKFDPSEDLVRDRQGLHRWAGNKPKLEDDIRRSLGSRNEDER